MSEENESPDVKVITASRSCEHFSVNVTVSGDMGVDLEMAALSRIGRALALLINGEDPITQHSELVGSITLENPTEESIRDAAESLLREFRQKIQEKDGD